jgi:hypothetical protein
MKYDHRRHRLPAPDAGKSATESNGLGRLTNALQPVIAAYWSDLDGSILAVE